MKFYSSRKKDLRVSAEQAIVGNLCPDGGLYMPEYLPAFKDFGIFKEASLAETGYQITRQFFSEDFSDAELKKACENAFNFPAPIIELSSEISVLELTHGPSLAFKDFGARFLGEMLSLIAKKHKIEYQILVATSGDTGGAVAAALEGKEALSVNILFPKGRISEFQKGQMTRFGGNVQTIEVEGSFDDCQRMVKEAFMNPELKKRESKKLISANSINIARLIAQTVYYIHALKEKSFEEGITFVVPSGNLGNLTAGIFAVDMLGYKGKFVSAHNANSTFPDFLDSWIYQPKTSVKTLSNAMDVGAPSNFERLRSYLDDRRFKEMISACRVSDDETISCIRKFYEKYSYLACPHTAVALHAAEKAAGRKIVLSTAAPVKFADILNIAGIDLQDSRLDEEVKEAGFRIKPELSSLLPIIQ